jgi:hypothetical protein
LILHLLHLFTPSSPVLISAMRFFFTTALLASSLLFAPALAKSKHDSKASSNNTLPEVAGASIVTGLPIANTSGELVYYISNNVTFSRATRALIVVHGDPRDAWNNFVSGQAGVQAAAAAGLVKAADVVIAAPQFFNGDDKGKFPVDAKTNAPTSSQLVWKGASLWSLAIAIWALTRPQGMTG